MIDIKKRLSSIQERQVKNNQALEKHIRFEEELESFAQREIRLFSQLHDMWGKDSEQRASMENTQQKLQNEQRKITEKLHEKKQALYKEKRTLLNMEEEERAALRRAKIREETL